MTISDIDILVHLCLWIYVSFVFGKYLGVKLLDHRISSYLFYTKLQELSPKWLNPFVSSVHVLILDIQVDL